MVVLIKTPIKAADNCQVMNRQALVDAADQVEDAATDAALAPTDRDGATVIIIFQLSSSAVENS